MGYLFQMKHFLRIQLLIVMGLVVIVAAPLDSHALLFWNKDKQEEVADKYIYEEKDADEEKKQYMVKLDQDKRKVELAIINTKTLISRSKNRPYLSELYLRLAELYIEKSRVSYFLRKRQQDEGGGQALDQYESNMLKKQAVEIYQRILNQDPDFEYIDKVYFFMAHEYYELGQIEDMLKQYQILIQKYPNSQYAPEAQLLLGDYYFNQKGDVDLSTKHYEAVLNYPQSPAVAAARYKLAWCRINLSDYAEAIKLFEQSVLSAQPGKDLDIDTYRRVDVRLESLVDMAYCYPEVYKKATPEQALAYFKQYAWSRPVYTTVLEKLAFRYYVKKKWAQAAPLYRELATIRQDPEKLLEYSKHIFESVQALGTYRHAEKDVAIIVRALKRQVYSAHMAEAEKEKLINDYEIFARDIITHLHAKARQTNSIKDFVTVADAYKEYLEFFRDSPAAGKMAANYAEALFSAERYLDAGKEYEKVTPAATANTTVRREALYSAVISYYRALKNKENLNFYQAAYAREGLRSVGKTYAGEYPNSKNTPDVMFNVAWTSYDDGNYGVAITDLSNFVNRYPSHPAATAAIHLVMDAYHLLENYEGMINYGKTMLAGNKLRDPKLRQEVAQLVKGAESKVVSGMTVAAMDDWDNTRKELMNVIDSGEKTAMGEQALNALIVTSRGQKDLPTLFDAGNKLIRTYPGAGSVKDTLGMLIDTSVSIGQLRLLADYLETTCKKYPGNKNNGDFMMQAAIIREGLGQLVKANQNYRQLLIQYPNSVKSWDDIVFAMVDNSIQMNNPKSAIGTLQAQQKRLSANGKLRAQAQMAVLSLNANRRSQALKYSNKVLKSYQPKMGGQDPMLRDLVAEIAYQNVKGSSGSYFKLRLKKKIDNKVVERKAKMLNKLEQGYQKVLEYKSPAWALKACFRANELYREFADFLLNSPVPSDLTAEQKNQYQNLIQQKAKAYDDKSQQYLKTCVELARKWEICDPQLSGYFYPAEKPQGGEGLLKSISGRQASAEIGAQGLNDQSLSQLYSQLLKTPDDVKLQLKLAKAYLRQGDYRQSALVAKNALPKIKSNQRSLKAELLNLVGVTHLYCGKDPLAKETFKRALDADNGLEAARVNLAGLYRHYGHEAKAAELMKDTSPMNLDRESVHPRLGAQLQ
jgi:tetratricopeptide (TPR) repeat protein